MKKKLFATLGLSVGLLTMAGIAQASSEEFSVNVKAYNGKATTTWIGKDTLTTSAVLMKSVGGNYTVDARLNLDYDHLSSIQNTAWVQNVDDTSLWTYKYSDNKGYERVEFSNDLTTPVQVNVKGIFDTNF